MSQILIVGGHGKIALQAAERLTGHGHAVTSLVRNPDHVADVEATGARALVMDLESAAPEDLATVFSGQDAIVFSAGAGGGNPARTKAVDHDAAVATMRAAEAAGVDRYVMVSYLGASLDHGVPEGDDFHPYAEAKAAADEALRTSRLDWTILGPARLTDEPSTGKVTVDPDLEADGAPAAETSRATVAEAIAVALQTPQTVGRQLEFVDGDTPLADAFAATSGPVA